MTSRAVWYALLAGTVSMSSGCYWFRSHFPNVGWRLQHCGPACPPACGPVCPPVCSPSLSVPVLHRPPVVVPGGPDCVGCNGAPPVGPPVAHPPAGYPPFAYPQGAYPPVIGNPVPLPGAGGLPSEQLPSPMPIPKTGGN
jgi:hypothetical protein